MKFLLKDIGKVFILTSGLVILAAPSIFSAEPLPLSSYWKDPAFLKSFNGSYRIEARIEPNVTSTERGLLVEVQTLMGAENRTAALKKLESSPITKKSPALTFNLANLYFETGKIEKSIETYQAALKEYPSFRRAHHNLALAFIREEKLEDALTHLTEAIRLGDSEGSTYGMLGYCRLARQEYASALQAYRLAQVTEPNVPEWSAGIAQCLQNLGGETEAAALLDEVIRKRPLESSFSVLQANIYLNLNQPESAVKALELPYRLDRLDADQSLLLADLHLRAQRHDASTEVITYAFSKERKPSLGAVLRLVTTSSSQANWPLVKDLLEKAKEEKPSRPLQLATAKYLIASGENPPSGAEILERLVYEDPTDGVATIALAKHLVASGQPRSAQLLFERATVDSTTSYEAHVELARLHVSQSSYSKAIFSIDAALAINPTEALRTYREALLQTLLASE